MTTNNQTVLFLSYTSEFLPSDAILVQENFSNNGLEITGDLYSTKLNATELAIEFFRWLEPQVPHPGDDAYFDYIPDAVDTLLQVAAKKKDQLGFQVIQGLLSDSNELRDLYWMNPLNGDEDAFCWDCITDPMYYQAYRDLTLAHPLPVLA